MMLLGCGNDNKRGQGSSDAGWDLGTPGEGDDTGPAIPGHDAVIIPPGTSGVVTLMDAREVQLQDGVSEVVDFVVPPGTVAVTVTVEGTHWGEMYALESWTGPEGSVLVQENWPEDEPNQLAALGMPTTICHTLCSNRIAASEAAFAAIAPNNPEATVVAGAHQLTVYGIHMGQTSIDLSNSNAFVTIHAKILDAEPQTGILDLNLHFTGSNGWTAQSAQQDPVFAALMDGVDEIYSQIGIEIGEVAWLDADTRFQVIETIQGENSDLMELFSQTPSGALNAVNLFFVEEIKTPPEAAIFGGGTILGIAGGIPGPVIVPGTGRSGVAVGTVLVEGGPQLHQVVAHELGHYLGLFHTTENLGGFIGPAHDPLPDTPEGDESYLMHASGAGDTLSPWQGKVMRQNPWVRHQEAE